MCRSLRVSVLAWVILISPTFFFAQADPSLAISQLAASADLKEPKAWWRTITTNGLASLSYGYNTNQPHSRLNQYRVFDFNDNEPQLDVAQLVIQRPIEKPNQFGFRLNTIAGSGVPEVTAAYGLFRNTHTNVAHHFDVVEAYLSYIVPVGKGLRLDAGKMAVHLGSEVIGGYDGFNDQFSRGLIFGYAIPFTYTGIKATYALTSKVTGMVVLANGWDEFQRVNHGYSWGGQIALTPTKTTTLYFNFIHGPERPRDDRDQRSVGEIVGSWKSTPRLTLGFDAVYGHEENAVGPGEDAVWKGVAACVKYGFTPKFSLAFRGEIFNDGGGTRTGTNQELQGYTFTPEYDINVKPSNVASWLKKIDGKFVVRGDFRLDHSSQNVFQTAIDVTVPHQFTAAVNLIYAF